MTGDVSRRSFLKGILAGAVVVGFDTANRRWVTAAEASGLSYSDFPAFDGVLYTDSASRAAAADDFGHIIHRQPFAVLKAGSVDDIVSIVRLARRYGFKIAGRGQGHSTYGQPQVEAGVVIDMNGLNQIHSISAGKADVDAGVIWSDLLRGALAGGQTPPVLTDYIELSVGGTLSVGGIGGTSYKHGVQADNVLELTVVTGEGRVEECSPRRNKKLFDSALTGLGQFGVIVRATVKLIPAHSSARVFLLYYDNIATFTADQVRLINEERFEYVEGQVVDNGSGGWRYMLEAAKFYTAPALPNNAALLAGLSHNPGSEQISDVTYYDFANRLAPTIEFLKAIGVWGFPHPWSDVFVPGNKVNSYVGGVVSDLTVADTGQGPVLLYPFKTSSLNRQFFRVPDQPIAFLFSILRTSPPDPAIYNAMIASNRELYERNRDLGGTRYAIGCIPFSRQDWVRHFGPVWKEFEKSKRKYDPDNVLTPGQGIF